MALGESLVVLGEPRSLELADLEAQHVRLVLGSAIGERGDLGADVAEGLPLRGVALGRGGGDAESVEGLALEALLDEPLVGVRAVDVDAAAAELAELGDGHALVVDPGAGASLPGDGAADDGVAEVGLDLGLPGAFADDGGVGAAAEHELERAHEDGLAGAGLAGNDVQGGVEADLRLLDDGEIPD